MGFSELLFWLLMGWTVLGVLGLSLSLWRRERDKVIRGFVWLAATWAIYLAMLVGTSLTQPQRVVAMGKDQCFHEMCFAVTGVEEVPGFLIHDGSRLLRVSVRVSNRGRGGVESERKIRAYLVDAEGRRWDEPEGLSGVRLTEKVGSGRSVVSEPVFKVPHDATGLELVLTRGWRQPHTLVIGDSDSLLHKKTVVRLGL
jgi:hypothetical protein